METNNHVLIEYRRKYQNKWVAKDVKTRAVLEADQSLAVLDKKMRELSKDYLLEKVLPLYSVFVPLAVL